MIIVEIAIKIIYLVFGAGGILLCGLSVGWKDKRFYIGLLLVILAFVVADMGSDIYNRLASL